MHQINAFGWMKAKDTGTDKETCSLCWCVNLIFNSHLSSSDLATSKIQKDLGLDSRLSAKSMCSCASIDP